MVGCLQSVVAATGDLLSKYCDDKELAVVSSTSRFFKVSALRLCLKLRHRLALLKIQALEIATDQIQELLDILVSGETGETISRSTAAELRGKLIALRTLVAQKKALLARR